MSLSASSAGNAGRHPRWVGLHIIWWGGNEWQFTNCVRCHEPLRSARAIQNGYGPGCAQASGIASLVRKTLREERERARRDLAAGLPTRPQNRRSRRAGKSTYGKPPTAKQMRLLRRLAQEHDITLTLPLTSLQAATQIDLLLKQPKK